MLAVVALQFAFPYLTIYIIDIVLPSKDVVLLLSVILVSALLYATMSAGDTTGGILFHYFREKLLMDVQANIFEHAQHLYLEDFQKMEDGELCSFLIKDVCNLRGLLADSLLHISKESLTVFVGLFLIFRLNCFIACLVLPFIILVFFISAVTGSKIRKETASYHSAAGKFMSSLMTSLFDFYFVKIYSIEDLIRHKVLGLQGRQFSTGYRLEVFRRISEGALRFLATIPPLVVFWYGGKQLMGGTLSLGELIGFNLILSYVTAASQQLANANLDIESSMASLHRLRSFLELANEGKHPSRYRPLPQNGYTRITFENVSFSYGQQRLAVEDVCFSLSGGEVVALVGPNGSGKSTLCKLLLRLYDQYTGAIRLNGVDIRELDTFEMRGMVAVVPQDLYVFPGTVRENISIGSPRASEAQIVDAAIRARIHETILSLPLSYDTVLQNGTIPFSGGEKQRLALARALLRGARILILDEATAQIDARSDNLIRKVVQEIVSRSVAALVIAHRLSTVIHADKIVVMDHGRILDAGNHAGLYERCRDYREFCDYQFLKPTVDEDDSPARAQVELMS